MRSTFYAGHFHTLNKGYLFDFTSTYAISTPVKSFFSTVFRSYLFSASDGGHEIGIKRCGILLRIFWYMWKVCRMMSTYSNAHANIINWIFDVRFPENLFGFGIILNDFWSSKIWAIQIKFAFAQFKNRKIPGIQPSYWSYVGVGEKFNQGENIVNIELSRLHYHNQRFTDHNRFVPDRTVRSLS